MELAEVYWADLTRVGVDTHHLLLSMVRFIYGIRHLVLQAALIPGKFGWGLSAALRSAFLLVQGPIYSLYVFEAVLCIVYLAFLPDSWDQQPSSRTYDPPALSVLAIAVVGAQRGAMADAPPKPQQFRVLALHAGRGFGSARP